MMLLIAFILLVLLFTLPFVPGARELAKKQDASPLYINNEYLKDPRYFAFSFRKLFHTSLAAAPRGEGVHDITLSKNEKVQIVENASLARGSAVEHILYVMQDLESGSDVRFNKEVYVRQTAHIGESNLLQALACDGDIHLRRDTRFFRWLDAEGNITAERSCILGVDASCSGILSLEHDCSFLKLYGFPVVASGAQAFPEEREEPDGDTRVFDEEPPERECSDIKAASRINRSIISAESVTIGELAVIRGHVKTHGNLVTGAGVIITGNVFAAGNIELGPHSRVLGTVFSQEHIVLRQGVRVGAKNKIKSVVGKKSVMLENGATIYGYVMTEGRGLVA